MTILITGSEGFIGSHLHLEKEKVLRIDKNLPDSDALKAQYQQVPFLDKETIIHLAATSSIEECSAQPTRAFNNNCSDLIPLIIEQKPKSFIFVSSVAADVLNPQSIYGVSKASAELLLQVLCKQYNIDLVILRLPNVYGPGGKGIVDKLISSYKNKTPITILDGRQTRNFVHVKDVAKAIEACLTVRPGTYTLASKDKFSVDDITSMLVAKGKESFTVTYSPFKPGEIFHSNPINNFPVDCCKHSLEVYIQESLT